MLTGYGTGAIMAVPAHDARDFEFAQKFSLPIVCIQDPDVSDPDLRIRILEGKECWTEDGRYINSSDGSTGININGLNKDAGISKIISWLESKSLGSAKINYKLRDWLFSRQLLKPFPLFTGRWRNINLDI
jgi:leucyl-tRNA synthetase